MEDLLLEPTTASIAAAKAQQQIDRAQVALETGWVIDPDGNLIDPVSIGMRMGNVISAAVYGSRGEWRG